MRDIIVFLCTEINVTDEIGQDIGYGVRETEVFASKQSITQKEFYSAAQSGLEPDFRLNVSEFDYNGEKNVKVDDVMYKIYRTYVNDRNEEVELYCARASGIDTEQASQPVKSFTWGDLSERKWG